MAISRLLWCPDSNPTNESCEPVIDPSSFSTLEIPSITVGGGNDFVLTVSLSNQYEVAGFQFALDDNPDYLTGLSATTTERTEGFEVIVIFFLKYNVHFLCIFFVPIVYGRNYTYIYSSREMYIPLHRVELFENM